jgi:hypothetical protein
MVKITRLEPVTYKGRKINFLKNTFSNGKVLVVAVINKGGLFIKTKGTTKKIAFKRMAAKMSKMGGF